MQTLVVLLASAQPVQTVLPPMTVLVVDTAVARASNY